MTGAIGLGTGVASGQLQTIAIVDAYTAPNTRTDANKYFTAHGVVPFGGAGSGTLTLLQQTPTIPAPYYCQGPDEWSTEQMLDIESAHTIAPASNIVYYGAKDCAHLYDPLNAVVSRNLASIVSNSWGSAGEDVSVAERNQAGAIFTQAAAQGISVFFSSGDNGDNAAGLPAADAEPDFPASSPLVTSVGGTSMGIGNVKPGPTFQTGWESQAFVRTTTGWKIYDHPEFGIPDGFAGGAGGGVSHIFAEPSWQKRFVPSSYSHGFRTVPDVASLADPYTGFLVGGSPVSPYGYAGRVLTRNSRSAAPASPVRWSPR